MKHPAKQVSIALRVPSAFETQPETKPPESPPAPNSIILIPLSRWPSDSVSRLCTQVGTQENTAHSPISISQK